AGPRPRRPGPVAGPPVGGRGPRLSFLGYGPHQEGHAMKVAIVGATGLIGRRLVEVLLGRGDEVVPVSRRGEDIAGVPGVRWDPAVGDAVPAELTGADAVVNLAGAGIGDARWTDARK